VRRHPDLGERPALGEEMLGIARIYSRKTKYLLDDAQETLHKVKKAFQNEQRASSGRSTAARCSFWNAFLTLWRVSCASSRRYLVLRHRPRFRNPSNRSSARSCCRWRSACPVSSCSVSPHPDLGERPALGEEIRVEEHGAGFERVLEWARSGKLEPVGLNLQTETSHCVKCPESAQLTRFTLPSSCRTTDHAD
jgi:hypothetical protein